VCSCLVPGYHDQTLLLAFRADSGARYQRLAPIERTHFPTLAPECGQFGVSKVWVW
jgi:hypothetical protein